MNDEQLNKLFQAARAKPDTSRVEYGFETRLLARLRTDETPWFALAWKLVPVFVAVVVSLGAWNYAGTTDLPMAGNADDSTLAAYLTGGRL
jgi:hypothetical protein